MEWSSKVPPPPPWDMAELKKGADLSMGALAGPGFVLGSQSGGLMDCSVDLRLGGLGEFRRAERWLPDPEASETAAAAPSRRARASGNACASCLVDECKSDLSNSREYHRRHKVCEVHSKTPVVMVGGQEQRFCQQCSRFHQLVEFDEVKRSCRKRLDGHNRRRRKPPPESINTSSLFPSTQGSSRFLIMYPPPDHATSPTPAQGHKDTVVPLATSFLDGDAGPPFSQSTLIYRPMLKATPSAESGSWQAFDSDCALSLLSAAAQDSGIGLQMLPAGRIPPMQYDQPLLVSDLADQASCYAPVGDVFVCEGGGDCQCVYNAMGEEGRQRRPPKLLLLSPGSESI